eukprot:gene27659-36470_t
MRIDKLLTVVFFILINFLLSNNASRVYPTSSKEFLFRKIKSFLGGIPPLFLIDYQRPAHSSELKVKLFVALTPGYRVPRIQYESFICSLKAFITKTSPRKVDVVEFPIEDFSLDGQLIDRSYLDVLYDRFMSEGFDDNSYLLLVGHSKGGAVLTYFLSRFSGKLNSRRTCLILFDPVDSPDNNAIREITGCRLGTFAKTLIVSTPYGGRSAYYNTNFESSCAPRGRNALVFFEAISAISSATVSITFPTIGHMQFLDDRKILSIASVCASSPGIDDDKEFQRLVMNIMYNWILFSWGELFYPSIVTSVDDSTISEPAAEAFLNSLEKIRSLHDDWKISWKFARNALSNKLT